jgi:hypothetical protein
MRWYPAHFRPRSYSSVESGSLLARQGADPEAERVLRHAVSLDPDGGEARYWLGKYLYARGDDQGRLELLRAQDRGCPRALAWLAAREHEDRELLVR